MTSKENYESDRLKELSGSNFEITEGEPDIRGWTAKNGRGKIIGKVKDLLFDTESGKVRYIILDLKENELHLESRKVLVPIGIAELHDAHDNVIFPGVMANELTSLPTYEKGMISRQVESSVRDAFGSRVEAASDDSNFYNHRHFDQHNLYHRRQNKDHFREEKPQTVIGIFRHTEHAEAAVKSLKYADFNTEHIDMSDDTDSDSGISGFFHSLFSSDEDKVRNYTEAARNGIVVTVHAQSAEEAERAAQILDENGAISADGNSSDHPHTIIQEPTGKSSSYHSKIIDHPLDQNYRLRSKLAKPGTSSQPTNSGVTGTFQEGSIDIIEHKEVPVVGKEARMVEQVSLNKEIEETDETIKDKLRSTDVKVERITPRTQRGDDDQNWRL
ncbi:PRC-barrel domain-containing protein [Rubrolithibacter danxiaensis]|uniref:PRC-barrel domain-containing protein n=1 Tax=Rubrolithibacter danxiaensis TaxID=3390805 RepID=UPI003BF783A0